MSKIYFAAAWGLSNKLMTDWYKLQTPNSEGIWGNLEVTYNKEEADYIIVQDGTTDSGIDKSKVIFMGKEPRHIGYSRWGGCFKSFHHEDGDSWMPQTWWLQIPYNNLKNDPPPLKTKNLSVINSNKRQADGQRKRSIIIDALALNYPDDVDIWGATTKGRTGFKPYKDTLPPKDKSLGLLPYRYHFVCENGSTPYYFTEKLMDPLLCWTVPIYWGCSNVSKFLPQGSYVDINIDDKHAVEKIIEISKSSFREDNMDKIKEARDLILNRYNIWGTVELALKDDNLLKKYIM